jgi:N-terminal acetyltransferase B complex non-catalytic subunit
MLFDLKKCFRQAAKIDAVYKLCSFAAVERVVSLRLKTNTAPAARAAELMKPYHIIRALNITKETTERLPGDDLVVLAAHYLIDAYRAASDASDRSAFLLDAAAICEYALQASKFNFQFRLMLSYIYQGLGAAKMVAEQFDGMDIKQIQLDTLGYVVLDHYLRFGLLSALLDISFCNNRY